MSCVNHFISTNNFGVPKRSRHQYTAPSSRRSVLANERGECEGEKEIENAILRSIGINEGRIYSPYALQDAVTSSLW